MDEEEGIIWPKKRTWSDVLGSTELDSLFPQKETPRELYLPGKRPNEIAIEKWNQMILENPMLINTDLPIAVSKQGEVVCIERPKTALRIALVGVSQVGKTTLLFSLGDQLYWNWGYKCFFANEGLSLCYDHLHKNNSPAFKDKLAILGIQPQGLPLVFCYPSTENMNLPGIYPEHRISISFKEFLKDPAKFCDLAKSEKHVARIKDELLKCTNMDEVEQIVTDDPFIPTNSKMSITASIHELVRHKIFDLNDNAESFFTLKNNRRGVFTETALPPILALMKCGLVPCLMTSRLAGSKYEEQVFNHYLREIWYAKEKGGVLRDDPIVLLIDELNQVQGNNREILIKMVREGANMGREGIGFFWCAQNYTLIDPVIRTNTPIGVVFRQAHEDATAIQKEFCLTSYWVERIKTLAKFECILVTKDRFKLYNPLTGKWCYTSEPIIAETIPPMSLHRGELSIDAYNSENRKHISLHERVLVIGRWILKDKTGTRIYHCPKGFANVYPKPEGGFNIVYETVEMIKERLNPHTLTIKEGFNLKQEYFEGRIERTEMLSYQELQRKGLRIISIPANITVEGKTQIRVIYLFWPIKKPTPNSARLLQACPDVTITYNNDNNAVRMFGTNCASLKTGKLNGASDWFYLDTIADL